MKSRIAVLLVMLLGIALLFGCATSGKEEGALDPNLVRSDNLALWDELGWVEMTPAEQALWKALGWNEASWEGEAKKPPSEDKYWRQLTDAERMAAQKLGYTKESWDE